MGVKKIQLFISLFSGYSRQSLACPEPILISLLG